MATLLLSAAGAALGGSLGGSVLGVATGAVGKAVGATFGAVIDQRLTGLGSEAVETGRVERFKVMGASEGEALPRVFGRVRLAGQMIWSSRFLEDVDTRSVGGKGAGGGAQKVREYSYSISLALALCEGEVMRVGRVWADGQPLDLSGVAWRLHTGTEDQIPDPLIAAIEGAEAAPAYRGVAYVVLENLELAPFGNRIPQLNFEVFRRPAVLHGAARPPALDVRGVALVPGTGEYALATTPVHLAHGKGRSVFVNVNNDRGAADLVVSLEQMQAELPAVGAASLVVSWFGDDLRCATCRLEPAVEQAEADGRPMPWRVSGCGRASAKLVSRIGDRPAFGGTPADASVVEAIRHMTGQGVAVMFYPFILMDIQAGNGLPDPWGTGGEQPRAPWRGRITLSVAPGRSGSPDRTAAAAEEVAAFFGSAQPEDFAVVDGAVVYSGPDEWSYRRFVLHYAHLCALAGGVDAFCIGSEMRALSQIRDGVSSYPAVRALCTLAEDVRTVFGSQVRIGYAADWSEYFGHQPTDGSGDVLFHLDPLWAHRDVDFVGVDNYMPLSDWREGTTHADAAAGSIYDLAYLEGNVEGGEGYDWHYPSSEARERQERAAITDGAYGEPWVFRYKDIRAWWSLRHHDRVGGIRSGVPTAWVPGSKPIWFTELGCPAVDKGTNQPNVFHDPKSDESFFPYHSTEARDDFIQQRYLQAVFAHWTAHNPTSDRYEGTMVDMSRAFVWAWDARPWPDFPDRLETWSDGDNFGRGHWINARLAAPALADVVGEICTRAGVTDVDPDGLDGTVTGYQIGAVESARQSLQPLMLTHGFNSFSDQGKVAFAARGGRIRGGVSIDGLAVEAGRSALSLTRGPLEDSPGRIEVSYVRGDGDYEPGLAAATAPERPEPDASQSSVPVVMSEGEARAVAERWLSESLVARDVAEFRLPPSMLQLTAGDVVSLEQADGGVGLYRIDRVEEAGSRAVSAVRVEPGVYRAPAYAETPRRARRKTAAGPAHVELLDLPLLSGGELPHAPHVAAARTPWEGPLAVFSSSKDAGYVFDREVLRPATMGVTLDPLARARAGAWSRQELRVRLSSGALRSAEEGAILNGANAATIRHGVTGSWEVVQFASAQLVGPDEYLLGGLLRGQAGTDGVMSDGIPVGADFVLLDAAVVQLDLPASMRGLDRHYRIGAAALPYSHPSYVHSVARLEGVGLRPYRPAHLAAQMDASGDILISWVRRTRVDGDSWEGADAPLGEERELYHVRVSGTAGTEREMWTEEPGAIYGAAARTADGLGADLRIEVAQVSDRFGPGPYASVAIPAG